MVKLVVSEFMSLDGVIQAPGDPNEDRSGGFEHGGWQLDYFDDVFGDFVQQGLDATGSLLLGRLTYVNFANYWPTAPDDIPITPQMNGFRKYVVSSTLTEPLPWQRSTLIKGDIADEVRKLKAEPGKDIQVMGSGQLVQTLVEHDLVDEYRLMIHPLVLGKGKRLFRDESTISRLRLIDSRVTATGVLLLTYLPATT